MLKYLIVFLVFCFSAQPSSAQYSSVAVTKDDTFSINKKKLTAAIVTIGSLYVAEMSFLSYIWYDDKKRVPFEFYKDGKGYLQVDKFGHAYGSYIESYIGYKWLRSAGVPKNKALLYGGTLGILLQAPIEIFDGLYEGWGFSWSDILANSAGSAILIGQEILFDDQVVRYKFSFSRSLYAKQSNGYLGDKTLESFFNDYNGHTYWLSTNANRLLSKKKLPVWLNIAVGYSANGMFGEFENIRSYRGVSIPETKRYRQYLLSVDIDWSKIKTRSQFLKAVFKGLDFIKIPAPTLEFNSLGKFKGYALYF